MVDVNLVRQACWCCLGALDTAALAACLSQELAWPVRKGGQPQRVRLPDAAREIIEAVLAWFPAGVMFNESYACLSKLMPGQSYEMHRDPQPPEWITRVHVPLTTNPGAWLAFEREESRKVHFELGKAYSFNTLELHAFGNDGATERVHLLFDVSRT